MIMIKLVAICSRMEAASGVVLLYKELQLRLLCTQRLTDNAKVACNELERITCPEKRSLLLLRCVRSQYKNQYSPVSCYHKVIGPVIMLQTRVMKVLCGVHDNVGLQGFAAAIVCCCCCIVQVLCYRHHLPSATGTMRACWVCAGWHMFSSLNSEHRLVYALHFHHWPP